MSDVPDMTGSRYLCLHMPYLATDRVRRVRGWSDDEGRRPLVLTCQVGAAVEVACLDARAAQLGLRAGLSLGQAQAMVPELLAWPYEPQRDRAVLWQLAAWAVRFSPQVEPVEPGTLLIDITGCQRLFGGEANIVRQAVDGLARQGFFAQAAIADTVGAAGALASSPTEDRCHIVPPGQASAYLAPLSPAALRIDAGVSARLDALGVRTIGDLLMLPRASLPARFGPQLVQRLQQALGEVFEGVALHQPEQVPQARLSLEHAAHELPAIQPIVDRLLAEVFEQLRRRDLALRRLDCVLYFERTPPATVSIGFSRASRAREHAAKLLHQRLERVDLSAGVCGLMVAAGETSRWRPGQTELFEQRAPDEEEALAGLMDRLANRLGYDAVLRAQLIDDHQPEMAFRYVSVAEAGCEPGERAAKSDHLAVCARPVRLLPRPVPIRVMALVPDGPPTWFAYRGREHAVVSAGGPERLETAWWRGPDIRRDYFRVTAETGAQFWLFHAFNEQQWYLHGVFA